MRTFSEYAKDHKVNALYYGVKEYDLPDHFLSFKPAVWEQANSKSTPTGIVAYNIQKTMHHWKEDEGRMLFGNQVHESAFILKGKQTGTEYTWDEFNKDAATLESLYKIEPNKKLIKQLRKNGLDEQANQEKHKFKRMMTEALANVTNPDKALWETTKWIAAGNKNPSVIFPDNAPQRWNNIFRKLGYDAIAVDELVIFFDINGFEVIDEVKQCN